MNVSYELPPMRTIKQAAAEIKAAGAGLSEWTLRKLIIDGEVPSVKVGNKYYINMKVLTKYLIDGNHGNGNAEPVKVKDYGKIRIVAE